MRFRHDDDPALLEIELVTDDGFGESDVSFGQPRRPWSPRRKALLGVGVAGVLLGGTFVLSRTGDTPDAATPDTTVESSTTTTTDPSPTTTRVRPSTTTTVYTPPAQLSTDPGWRVYLSSPEGTVREFDPVTGELGESNGSNYGGIYAVARGPEGPKFFDYGTDDVYTLVGDGTGWKWIDDQIVHENVFDGTVLESIPLSADVAGYYGGEQVMGTTSEGRPIILLDDVRAYEVAPDGSLRRFSEGAVLGRVVNGNHLEHTCDEAGNCRSTLRTAAGSLEIAGGANQLVGFSPSGTHVVTLDYGGSSQALTMYDVRTGPVFTENFVQMNGYTGSAGGWSPDGRYFFFVSGSSLEMFDSTDNSVVELTGRFGNVQSVLAVV